MVVFRVARRTVPRVSSPFPLVTKNGTNRVPRLLWSGHTAQPLSTAHGAWRTWLLRTRGLLWRTVVGVCRRYGPRFALSPKSSRRAGMVIYWTYFFHRISDLCFRIV